MKAVLLALSLALAAMASAQTQPRQTPLYRCGPDGRDLRDSPCPSGPSASGSISYDQPSAADSRAARERHRAEAKQAHALAAARRASEAEARHQRGQAVGLQTLPPPAQPASSPQAVHLKPPKLAKPRKPQAAASGAR